MKNVLDQLERLNFGYHKEIAVSIILDSLSKDFEGFVGNYNMNDMRKTIVELHDMLVEYENSLSKKSETPGVMLIKGGRVQKKPQAAKRAQGKGKGKQVVSQTSNPKKTPTAKKEHPGKNETCHCCIEMGHWRRNCPTYLTELIKKRKQATNGYVGTPGT